MKILNRSLFAIAAGVITLASAQAASSTRVDTVINESGQIQGIKFTSYENRVAKETLIELNAPISGKAMDAIYTTLNGSIKNISTTTTDFNQNP